MKTTVKLLAAAVALCIVPATYAITPEQAAANLQGAQQFSHLADKSYSTAMYNEHLANLAKGNAIYTYGPNSTEAIKATQAYDAALTRVTQTRQDARLGRLQVAAANRALITATPTPVPTVNPTLYRQDIAKKQAALIAPPVVNPTTTTQTVPTVNPTLYRQDIAKKQAALIAPPVVNPTTTTQTVPTVNPTLYRQDIAKKQAALIAPPVITPITNGTVIPATSLKPSTKVPVTPASGTNTVTTVQHVNTYYVDQATRSKVSSNSDAISQNSQQIDRNAKDIEDTRDELKRGLNNAAAMSSLHYHSDNAWALSTGTANGDGAALAGGVQKGLTSHVAVNVQASTSFDSGWMAGAGISGDF
ncbi:hypothetical protein [Enterobacter sp. CP102]|uniref:hypothetical protein n=1 Tax=Enterobacter sp. CP102 TaxID=2976431 RepID=UPI00220F75C3|nr:hypothetical protein [Enterobacter sp. CP102]UWM65235.1 hypothetical protein N1249_05230 [Enterobacter sp. CP102]